MSIKQEPMVTFHQEDGGNFAVIKEEKRLGTIISNNRDTYQYLPVDSFKPRSALFRDVDELKWHIVEELT